MKRSNFSIIGDRYLDTQFDDEYINNLEKELEARGITGIRRLFLEYIAASALWWNVIWWEWVDLDERDIKIGWLQNFIAFGVIAVPLGTFVDPVAGIAAFAILHILTVRIGIDLRAGTKESESNRINPL